VRGNKADAKALFAQLHDGISQIATTRQEAREKGYKMPDDIREHIIALRRKLLLAGLSPQQIDSTPGLEPVD
jgi:hypothetical protein